METKKTKKQVIEELVTLRPYLGNKIQGLRNQSKEELQEFLTELLKEHFEKTEEQIGGVF